MKLGREFRECKLYYTGFVINKKKIKLNTILIVLGLYLFMSILFFCYVVLGNEIEYLYTRASDNTHENGASHNDTPSNNKLLHSFNLPSFDGISITYICYYVKLS